MKEYRFHFVDNYGGGDVRDRYFSQWISDNIDPKKYGLQLAKDFIYGKKQEFKMYGKKQIFYDCQYKGHELINDNIEQARKDYFKARDEQQKRAAEKLKRTVEKMDFDYYQIKGKWNAATVSRRADKIEEAERAADELEEAGAVGVEIVGVKAGKRETLRGKNKAPKADKVQAKKKKAAQAAKKPKDKIKTDTPKSEQAAQLDLFNDIDKKNIWSFNNREITYIKKALYEQFETGRSLYGLKTLLTNFEKLNDRQKIELSNSEITNIYESLLNYRFKHNVGATGPTFFEISRLMESLKKGV